MSGKPKTERNQQVVRMYDDGLSCSTIAKTMGIGSSRVSKILRSGGAKMRKHTRDKAKIERGKKMIEAYQAGASSTEVEKMFGVSVGTVFAEFKLAGLKMRRATFGKGGFHNLTRRKCDWGVIESLYKQGVKIKDISSRTGMTNVRIDHIVRRLGLSPRYHKPKKPTERDVKVLSEIKSFGVNETARRNGLTKQRVSQIKYRWQKWAEENT